MKYAVYHKHPLYPNDLASLVGFTNSLDNFVANNKGYTYKVEDLYLYELHEDVFAGIDIRQQSNFKDYSRLAQKAIPQVSVIDIEG